MPSLSITATQPDLVQSFAELAIIFSPPNLPAHVIFEKQRGVKVDLRKYENP